MKTVGWIATGFLICSPLQAQVDPAPAAHRNSAIVYKCVDSNGVTVFTQAPCSSDASKVAVVDTTRALRTGNGGGDALTGVANSAALSSIDTDCRGALKNAADNYSSQIDELRSRISHASPNLARGSDGRWYYISSGVVADSVRENTREVQNASLEAKITALESSRDTRIQTVKDDCVTKRDAEIKRQAAERTP